MDRISQNLRFGSHYLPSFLHKQMLFDFESFVAMAMAMAMAA
jgi:hypothetical protein